MSLLIRSKRSDGFTLLELLIVIAIIGVLAAQTLLMFSEVRKAAQLSTAMQEFRAVHQSLVFYFNDNGTFPADTTRDVPPGLEEYLAGGVWPKSPWNSGVYDWDRYTNQNTEVLQISVRFCPIGQPTQCNFPDEPWAQDFEVNSSVYYCIQGACKAHPAEPDSYPGYCINCN